MCRVIADPDIQLELLGHTNQDMTREELFHFVETKEARKRSATRLLDNQAAVIKSTYARNKKEDLRFTDSNKTDKSNVKCSYCGLPGHEANSSAQLRKGLFPAFNQT